MGAVTRLVAVISGGIGLIFTIFLVFNVLEKSPGDEEMQKLSKSIQVGARSFIIAEYRILFIVLALAACFLWWISSSSMAISFLFGSLFSALAGYFGLAIATRANSRTTYGATKSLKDALTISFNGGAVMGMTVVSLGLIGLGGVFFFLMGMLK